ncbi:glutathione S-transferase [Rhodovulum imhoffii]|uniref:Glutathione S-transferase n=1 Tax=Rhodovulum imhoffii TaxID=365340 RepID=A0A2T5BWH3_9RHOB|nr:glutathione S-transferase family protein [Rhodovulum imhoffii]MBK5935042.1 hypothetical protein [Rhodovulum imhoffii]PTN03993.1 glutathione S-transferase [Rhodovulum imhoffii]
MIRLHHCAQARSFRTLWLLHEMGVPFELVRHSFLDKSLRGAEYLALSPAGRVPALEIDGQVLFESGAITEYLVETRPACGLGRAPNHPERAAWLEWLHFAETIGQHLANLTQHHIVLREGWMRSPTVMRLEAKRLERTLGVIEAAVGDGFLLSSGFSAVDVNVGYGLRVARRFVPPTPALSAYYDRLAARPAFRAAETQDGPPELYKQEFYEAPDD